MADKDDIYVMADSIPPKKFGCIPLGLLALFLVISGGTVAYFLNTNPQTNKPIPKESITPTPKESITPTPKESITPTPEESITPTPGEIQSQNSGETQSQTPGETQSQNSGGTQSQTPGAITSSTPGGTQSPTRGRTTKPIKISPANPTNPTKNLPKNQKLAIYFDLNQAEVKPENISQLKSLWSKMKNGTGTVVIAGHTDNIGSEEYNQQLSTKRAQQVSNVLQELGIKERYKISVQAFGENNPVANNNTEKARAFNRRAEIYFVFEK